MRKLIRAWRASALFVGSVVGAGFATGQELQLFFRGDGVWSLALAALFMGIAAFAFMDIGARRILHDPRLSLCADSVITITSFAVYAAMIAASEEVLLQLTGMAGLSILLATAVMFLSARHISWISGLNVIAVPLMALIVILVGSRSPALTGGGFHPIRALAYGGMNLLFSGALMMEEGAALSRSERVIASMTAGILIFLMMWFMWRSINGLPTADMPFLIAASREGLGTLASISLLLAVVTTMASCAYLVTDRVTALTGDPLLSAPLVTLLGILTATLGFAPIVRATYPIVSYLGLAATLFALAILLHSRLPFRKRKRRVSAP